MNKKRISSVVLTILIMLIILTGCSNVNQPVINNGLDGNQEENIDNIEDSLRDDIYIEHPNQGHSGIEVDIDDDGHKGIEIDFDDNSNSYSSTPLNSKGDFTTLNDNMSNIEVIFFDVGQAESILIHSKEHNILIDAAERKDQELILNKIKNMGVDTLDLVVMTHPHADHIGGMEYIIKNLNIKNILMPDAIHTSKTYLSLLQTIDSLNIPVIKAESGQQFVYKDMILDILAPNGEKQDNLNNYSVVFKLTHGENKFMFTGDAEKESEYNILKLKTDLNSDVLSVGHHGSRTSTTVDFLNEVSPLYAVISSDGGEKYGHPHTETISKLNSNNINILRTDILGDIRINSDGQNLIINDKAAESKSFEGSNNSQINNTEDNNVEDIVYITNTGSKYHKDGCRFLKNSSTPINLNEAKSSGLEACKICFK